MQLRELKELVEKTSDAAFAIDGSGVVVAWNGGAEALFGLNAGDAIGEVCGEIVQGCDERGPICSRDCSVQQAVRSHHPVLNYDIQIPTASGMRWCNVSVLIADVNHSTRPYSLHIIRNIDMRKRLELLLRDFIVTGIGVPIEEVHKLISSTRAPARETDLSPREMEVLRLIAKGVPTRLIAEQLHISRTTVNNHVQHILRKLTAHSRLEAIRRAELAGLV